MPGVVGYNDLTRVINVESAGKYEIHFRTLQRANNLSPVTLYIDENVIAENPNNQNANFTSIVPPSYVIQEAGWTDEKEVFHHFNDFVTEYIATIELTEGTHNLRFFADGVKMNDTTYRSAFAVDNITFQRIYNSVPAEGTTLEAEDIFGLVAEQENANVSGGKYVYKGWGSGEEETVTGNVEAESAGYYDIGLLMNAVSSSVSAAVMYIDGTGVIYTSNNGKPTGEFAYESNSTAFPIYRHKRKAVYLTEGEHEISITFMPSGDGGKVVKYALDCIEFTPTPEATVEGVADATESLIGKSGETATMRMFFKANTYGRPTTAYGAYIIPMSLFDEGDVLKDTVCVSAEGEDGAIDDGKTFSADLTAIPKNAFGKTIYAIPFLKIDDVIGLGAPFDCGTVSGTDITKK